ncbi:MAG: DUF1461 domain-containing protein [Candidatus Woesearchaeota archaeon]
MPKKQPAGKKADRLENALAGVIAVSLALIIITSPFLAIMACKAFYLGQYEKNNLYSRIEKQDAEEITEDIINGLLDKEKIGSIQTPLITREEKQHLYDVSVIAEKLRTAVIFLAIIILLSLSILIKKQLFSEKTIARTILMSGTISLLLIILLAAISMASFQESFESFHRIFFPQGNYSFPADSLLITLFPQEFFRAASMYSAATAALLSLLCIAIGVILFNRTKKKESLYK